MSKPYRSTSSKGMRNLKSAANGIVRSTGKLAAKGTVKTFKWMATDHTGTADFCNRQAKVMEASQNINYSIAYMNLLGRRGTISLERLLNAIGEGSIPAIVFECIKIAYGWAIDLLLFLWDVLWGFIEPILFMLFMALLRIVLIVVCNVIFFGVIYLLLTA